VRTIPHAVRRPYRGHVKKVLLGLGMALVLALGGVGAATLAAGADHSDPGSKQGQEQAPAGADHGKPPAAGETGPEHAQEMRGFARAHQQGMKRWQECRRAGHATCTKPAPPGWLKHPDQHPGGWPPKHQKAEGDDDAHEQKSDRGDRD
jgi:hypothetical protein